MTIHDCYHFANENPVCFLATTDGEQPHVRAVHLWFADETGFYFQSGSTKEFYQQLRVNPKTEIVFFDHKNNEEKMLRVSGSIEFVNDQTLKEKVVNDLPFLKTIGFTSDSPGLIIFRLAHGQAHFWTEETNFKPKQMIDF